MKAYRNLSGNSGIAAYEIGDDYIILSFVDGSVYLYTNESAGEGRIERMKLLAQAGQGLTTFVNTNVRDAYARKLH